MPTKKLHTLNSEGLVISEKLRQEFDVGNFIPENWESAKEKPIIVDKSNPAVSIYITDIRTGNIVDKKINPFTECKVRGTIIGEFDTGELISQSTVRPVVYNGTYLQGVSGVLDPDYFPIVGSKGKTTGTQIGIRSLEFKGSYQNQNIAGSCVQLPSFSTVGLTYSLISGFIYMEQAATTNYVPIILKKDNVFSLEIAKENSQDRLRFYWTDQNNATHDIYCNPPGGITLNRWHHFAIIAQSPEYISAFWNGVAEDNDNFAGYKNMSSPVSVGGGFTGGAPFKGWISDFIISGGGQGAKRGASNSESTFTVPTKYQTADENTIYYMSMNGIPGTSIFPVEGNKKVLGVHSASDIKSKDIYASSVRYDLQNGIVFSGSSGGFTVGVSAGYLFGVRSGAAIIPETVTELFGITAAKNQKIQSTQYTSSYAKNSVIRGSNGDTAFFNTLYNTAAGYGGPTMSFRCTDSNITKLTTQVDLWSRLPNFGTTWAFIDDILKFQSSINSSEYSIISSINSSNNLESLRGVSGFESTGFLSLLAKKIQYAPDLEIPIQYKILGNEISASAKNV
jgi:Concanavalin A-like lectin/glucanases superfamily